MKKNIIFIFLFLIIVFSGCNKIYILNRTYSFQSYNYPELYVRHSGFEGIITEIVSETDVSDSSFVIVKGLADKKAISIESVNFPGYFLCVQNSAVFLVKNDETENFRNSATFYLVPSRLDPVSCVSFESYNLSGYFIRHSGFKLYLLENDNSDIFLQDSSFKLIKKQEG